MRPAALAGLLAAACAAPSARLPDTGATGHGSLPIELSGDFRQGGFARGCVPGEIVSLRLGESEVPHDDGCFFIAFGRDSPGAALTVRFADGSAAARKLDIAERNFPEERLPPLNEANEADPAFAERRAAELERIGSAREATSRERGWRQAFARPAQGRTSGAFGARRYFGDVPESPHSGVDIAAGEGTPVTMPADGRVVLASPPEFSLEGNLVIVDHGLGLYSSFLHLSRVDVSVGERLAKGARLGFVGASGRATGPHLHWGVMWNGVRFDPELLAAPAASE